MPVFRHDHARSNPSITFARDLDRSSTLSGPDSAVEALLASAEAFTRDGFAHFGYVEARPVSSEIVPDALITARTYEAQNTHFVGAVYDGHNRLIRSSLGFSEGPYTPLDPDEIAPERRGAAPLRVRRAIYGGTLYFVLGHFFFETVSRLWLLADWRRRDGFGAFPTLFHPWPGLDLDLFFANPLYRATLAALGIRRRDVGLAHVDLAVDALHYPAPLSIYHEYMHPQMSALLEGIADEITRPRVFGRWARGRNRTGSPRIFLSRGRWQANRRIYNEAGLEDLFRELGFAIVHPQDLAPAKLIELLRGASVLASTDGSQAHLAAFCRPGTRTILIDTRPVPTQFAIAKLRGLDALHIPVCTNGQWNGTDKVVDTSPVMARLLARAVADKRSASID